MTEDAKALAAKIRKSVDDRWAEFDPIVCEKLTDADLLMAANLLAESQPQSRLLIEEAVKQLVEADALLTEFSKVYKGNQYQTLAHTVGRAQNIIWSVESALKASPTASGAEAKA